MIVSFIFFNGITNHSTCMTAFMNIKNIEKSLTFYLPSAVFSPAGKEEVDHSDNVILARK